MILYDYDSNSILVEGISSRNQAELLRAYQLLLNQLKIAGVRPTIQRMWITKSVRSLRVFFKNKTLNWNYRQQDMYIDDMQRKGPSERGKNYFLAGLASLNPRFPLQFWSYLLPQSEITLNLIRRSQLNPKLLAHAQLNGMFDFNKTPLAPPGCEYSAFTPVSQRQSWRYHGQKAWYVRPVMNHYRCIHAINANTGRETTVETAQFWPHNFAMPAFAPHDLAITSAYDLTMALKNPHPASPLLPRNAKQVEELQRLATIISELANQKL